MPLPAPPSPSPAPPEGDAVPAPVEVTPAGTRYFINADEDCLWRWDGKDLSFSVVPDDDDWGWLESSYGSIQRLLTTGAEDGVRELPEPDALALLSPK